MELSILELMLISIASFRLSKLLMEDAIFEFIRKPFFTYVEKDGVQYKQSKGFIGDMFSCYWCLPVWTTLVLLVLYKVFPYILEPIVILLACSAVASFIYTIYDRTLKQ